MYYKPDWEKAKKRIEAWWHHEVIDRCCIAVLAPRAASKLPPFPDLQLGPWLGGMEKINQDDTYAIARWWQDPEANYQRMVTWFENTLFAGEALPITYIDWGSMAMAGILGCPMQFTKTTVQYSPVSQDWTEWHWSFDIDSNPIWRSLSVVLDRFIEGADGKFLVGPPNLGHGADVLAAMRGMDQFLGDLIDNPQKVRDSIDFVSDVWMSLMVKAYSMTRQVNHDCGVIPWPGLWAPGRTCLLACDISGVISPGMFIDLFQSDIEKISRWCDYGVYHLDGSACMKNTLDILLEIEQIKAIQFSPGIGLAPSYSEVYIPKYRKILEKGKGLYLLAAPSEVEKILDFLPPEGLFIQTYVDSEEEANVLLQKVASWSANSIN